MGSTSAPFDESFCPRRESSASAGGQLEHPSEVNSSTTTAFRFDVEGGLNDIATSTTATTSNRIPCSHGRRFFIHILYGYHAQTDWNPFDFQPILLATMIEYFS